MDLLAITRKIWRHRIATLPVIALTLLGAIYVVAIKSPEYWASSSYVLINPPPPPTAEEIAANPALGRIDPDNPYTRFTDQSVVVDLLASKLSNESARDALQEQGADPRYTVAPSSELGFSSVIIEISGVGSTPQLAVRTAELVGAALTAELDSLQASKGVEGRYRIQTQRVVAPESAEQRVSGKLRSLVGVFAMGAILLFVVISAAEALSTLRAERSRRVAPGGTDHEDPGEVPATEDPPLHESQNGRGEDEPVVSERRRRSRRAADKAQNGATDKATNGKRRENEPVVPERRRRSRRAADRAQNGAADKARNGAADKARNGKSKEDEQLSLEGPSRLRKASGKGWRNGQGEQDGSAAPEGQRVSPEVDSES